METKELEAIVEAVLFASGDKVSLEKLSEIIELDKDMTKSILDNLADSFKNSLRGIMIRKIDDGYQLCSKPMYHEYVKKLFEPTKKQGLSQATFETLSIIAYNAPITRAKIEQIRGVNSDSAVAKLLQRRLIRETGKLEAPGRPTLYETTEEFLRSFGFSSLDDLPVLEDVKSQEEEQTD